MLSQAELVKGMEGGCQPGPFETFQMCLAAIEKITQVRFPRVVRKAAAGPNESMRLTVFEKLALPAREVRPPSGAKVSP